MMNQVSLAPSQTAASGSTCSVLTSVGGHRTADAENRLAGVVAEAVLALLERGRRRQRHRRAAAIDLERQRASGIGADDALHVGEAFDRPAVDREHHIARLEPGRGGCGIGLHGIDPRGRRLPAIDRENRRENHDGQDEIGDRPGRDDGRAAPDRLMEEAVAALGLGHVGDGGLVRHAGGVVIAKKLHIAAERNGRKLPAGAVAIVEARRVPGRNPQKKSAPARRTSARPGNGRAHGRRRRRSVRTEKG